MIVEWLEGHVRFVPALFRTEPEEQLCRQVRWRSAAGSVHAPRHLVNYGSFDHTGSESFDRKTGSLILMQDGSIRWATEAAAADRSREAAAAAADRDGSIEIDG